MENKISIFRSLFGKKSPLIKNKDAYYLERLAQLESQIIGGDDFYGAWLDTERASLQKDADHPLPNVILGLLHMNGINVPQSDKKAEEFFMRSVELGCPFALKYLAALYNGAGDSAKGMHCIEEAVRMGDPEAMMMLGVYYVHEIKMDGGVPDFKRARALFEMAAKKGHEGARENLSVMNSRGE